ncbi:MAG: hypothetical protein IPL43_16045 [Micropruina sp.]|nr:hypothetical protein [Micropruina sp.]
MLSGAVHRGVGRIELPAGCASIVPGHEPVGRIVAVGSGEASPGGGAGAGETDYHHLPTASSKAAFGYNFEGALQEYVVLDERVIMDPATGARFLIPVSDTPTKLGRGTDRTVVVRRGGLRLGRATHSQGWWSAAGGGGSRPVS